MLLGETDQRRHVLRRKALLTDHAEEGRLHGLGRRSERVEQRQRHLALTDVVTAGLTRRRHVEVVEKVVADLETVAE